MHIFDLMGLDKSSIPDLVADDKFRFGVEFEYVLRKSRVQMFREYMSWEHVVPMPVFMMMELNTNSGYHIGYHIDLTIRGQILSNLCASKYMARFDINENDKVSIRKQIKLVCNVLCDLYDHGMFDPLDYQWYDGHERVMSDKEVVDMFECRSINHATHIGTTYSHIPNDYTIVEYSEYTHDEVLFCEKTNNNPVVHDLDSVNKIITIDNTSDSDKRAAIYCINYIKKMVDLGTNNMIDVDDRYGAVLASELGYGYEPNNRKPTSNDLVDKSVNSPLTINVSDEYLELDVMEDPYGSYYCGMEVRTSVTSYESLIEFITRMCQHIKNNPYIITEKFCGVHINISHPEYTLNEKMMLGYDYDKLFTVFDRSKDMAEHFDDLTKRLKKEMELAGVSDIGASYRELLHVASGVYCYPDIALVHEINDLDDVDGIKYCEFRSPGGAGYENKVEQLVQCVQLIMYIVKDHQEDGEASGKLFEHYWNA